MDDKELQRYIDSILAPKTRKGLTQATEGMTPAEQKQFLMSLQMGDGEFQQQVAPRMARKSGDITIDPRKAETHLTNAPLNLQGTSVPESREKPSTQEYRTTQGKGKLEMQPGSVNAVGVHNAEPGLWAHEYRHQENKDGWGENDNRAFDVIGSVTDSELKENLKMVLDADIGGIQRKYSTVAKSDPERAAQMKSRFNNIKGVYNAIVSGDDTQSGAQLLQEYMQASPDFAKKIQGYTEKDSNLEPTKFIRNVLAGKVGRSPPTSVTLPENYRYGGRVKLI